MKNSKFICFVGEKKELVISLFFFPVAKILISVRWLFRGRVRSHGLSKPVILSLTSYPPRFKYLRLTLKCLLTQSVKPDKVILWIAHEDKEYLPENVLHLQGLGLTICYYSDIKSYKKIVPILEKEKDVFIFTADDDVYYWRTWLEELLSSYTEGRKEVLCHRAHKIKINHDRSPLPYKEWHFNIADNQASERVFPTGIGGVLYPPNVFHSDVLKSELFMSLCPSGDDIWLYWMFRRNGVCARKVGSKRRFIPWPGTDATSLWNVNRQPDGNDLKIQAMIKRFGFPY